MSDQAIEASCIECKRDLSKEEHTEDCPIYVKQIADLQAAKAAKEKSDADALAKKEVEKARLELEEKKQLEIEKTKKELVKKYSIIKKIKQLVPDEKFDENEILELKLEQVFDLYNKILKAVNDEKRNAKLEWRVTCPTCKQFLGETATHDEAVKLLDTHKKEKHPSRYGGLIVTAVALSLISLGAIAVIKHLKNRKKKDDNSTESSGESQA